MSIRQAALAEFRATRATWMRLAREHREEGAIELCLFAVEGARIANANLLHVIKKVPQ